MDLSSILNTNTNDNAPSAERRPLSAKMPSPRRADSMSSTTPTSNLHSPHTNGRTASSSTITPVERPHGSDNKTHELPARPEASFVVTTKRKRENGEQKPKKRRAQEAPLWAQKIPERAQSGLSWHMLPKAAAINIAKPSYTPAPEQAAATSASPAQTQPQAVAGLPIHPFGSTYCNTVPADEVTRKVADFLYMAIGQLLDVLPSTNIEIEAKLGRIINRDTEDRVILPVQTEAVMTPNPNGLRTIFRSSMTEEEHMHFNKHLNTASISVPGPNGKTHERIQEIDSFWQLPRAEAIANIPAHLHSYVLGPGNAPVKVRISHAWNDTGRASEKACIIKRRISNIDIYNPNWPFDWRISVNIEYQYTGNRSALEPAVEGNGTRAADRAKNRLKYFYSVCDIDFTKVTAVPAGEVPGSASWEDNEHELEVELHSARLYEQLDLMRRRSPATRYEDLVRMLVDNVRVLTRSCGS